MDWPLDSSLPRRGRHRQCLVADSKCPYLWLAAGWPGHFNVVKHCIGNIGFKLKHVDASWCMDIQMDVDPAVRLPEAPVDAFQAQKRCWASLSQMKREEKECKKAVPIAFPVSLHWFGTSSTYQLVGITWNHAVLLQLLGSSNGSNVWGIHISQTLAWSAAWPLAQHSGADHTICKVVNSWWSRFRSASLDAASCGSYGML